jgi:hypothetical protein
VITWKWLHSLPATATNGFHWTSLSYENNDYNIQRDSYFRWPVHGFALHGDRCTAGWEAHKNFADESVCLMADNIWNSGKLLTLWTASRHYVSRRAVQFMRGNLFTIFQQWAADISSISRLFSVTISDQCVRHGAVHFRATCISVWHLRETQIC